MTKVLIIGCGYGGAVCAWRLSGYKKRFEIRVIDRGEYFNFLPLLPDAIGRGLPVEALRYPIKELSGNYGFDFINQEVKSISLREKKVFLAQDCLNYDYLVIACGSETNFYASDAIKNNALKLDNAVDAQNILGALDSGTFDSYIVCGGGYTGIEVATNLSLFLNRASRKARVIIVERAPSILGPLPQGLKGYVLENLKRLKIELFTESVIEHIEGRKILVSGAGAFDNSLLIWAAGVRTADFIQNLDVPKNPQGRIIVDEYLRVNDSCFAIGDASYFAYRGNFLRMAVQFAIAEAAIAAKNIINSSLGRPLRKYQPRDMGYIIPMANNRSYGNIMGVEARGFLPVLFHYIMAISRAYGLKNKTRIVRQLITTLPKRTLA